MAEAAGLVIGAVGLVSLAETVGDCFAKIETARNLGSDLVQIETQLAVAGLRYSRWLDTVRITDAATGTSQSNVQVASPEQASIVRDLLGGIEIAFKKASNSTSKYLVEETSQPSSSATSVNIDNRVELATRMNERAKRRQKKASLFRKMKWSLHDAKALKELASIVSVNVKALVELFPATQQAQQRVAVEDVRAIAPAGQTNLLELLAAVAMQTDPMLKSAADAEASRQGHRYNNTRLEERARALYGNDLAPGATVPRFGNDYNNSYAGGDTRAIYGDRVGFLKSVLDD